MRRPRRKFGKIPIPRNRGRLGGLVVMVEEGPINKYHPDGIYVTSNTILPDEIVEAARVWLRSAQYAEMDLTEYLNKMFDGKDYDKESI